MIQTNMAIKRAICVDNSINKILSHLAYIAASSDSTLQAYFKTEPNSTNFIIAGKYTSYYWNELLWVYFYIGDQAAYNTYTNHIQWQTSNNY